MRFIHTSDWHLGRMFHQVQLIEDQAHAMKQLVQLVEHERPDAVLVAGDVYDRGVPPREAVRLLSDTLTTLAGHLGTPVLIVAGNHDAPERLDFAAELLAGRKVHIRGLLDDWMNPVTLRDGAGEVDFYLIPFVERGILNEALLRSRELDGCENKENAEMLQRLNRSAAMEVLVSRLGERVRQRGRRAVLVTHDFVAGGTATEDSERPLSAVGGANPVACEAFGDFHYVALGHLHRPQHLGGRIHYAGSPLKYSFSEATHEKGVRLVELNGNGEVEWENQPIRPLRDVCVREGLFKEFRGDSVSPCDDFLRITLTDTMALHDAFGGLRAKFPNLLELAFASSGVTLTGAVTDECILHCDRESLFRGFFEQVSGMPPNVEEVAVFLEAAEAALHQQREE